MFEYKYQFASFNVSGQQEFGVPKELNAIAGDGWRLAHVVNVMAGDRFSCHGLIWERQCSENKKGGAT